MLKAVLFDLDDTLLGNSMEVFVPAYFEALTRYMAHLIPQDRLIAELMRGTRAMEKNDGSGPTNEEVFAHVFYPAVGYEQSVLEPLFRQFYLHEFPNLQHLTQQREEARPLVEWAFERGWRVVVATNPLFPRLPIEHRLSWAGVPADEFDYALLTCYENMHATKSHPAYYGEILERLDVRPNECLMVGDHWEWDILQSSSVGIPAYWIAEPTHTPPTDDVALVGQGTLAELWGQIETGVLSL
ncbi:MAG TPA: HAD family hydrolase [Chloroflexi bacterium]|mgnify:CR=1 FL=1|nr:HAD family hydrolase [Chloroflexota bacterium]